MLYFRNNQFYTNIYYDQYENPIFMMEKLLFDDEVEFMI